MCGGSIMHKGTFDWSWLEAAHPISSYILRPFTVMYGYLGCAHPENDQLYAAWQEAYRHWGVIPTLKPTLLNLSGTDGFARQFFDELHFWQRQRVDIDLEGSWPESVAFPWHTADGRRVVATQDRRWMCGDEEILRTVRGVNQLERAGMIPGWRAYDADRLMGLCPDRSYPVFPGTGPADELHICKMPDDIAIDYVAVSDQLAILAFEDAQPRVADLTAMLERALVGSRPADGTVQQQEGPGMLPDGSQFVSSGGLIHAHPPWKNGAKGRRLRDSRVRCPMQLRWGSQRRYIWTLPRSDSRKAMALPSRSAHRTALSKSAAGSTRPLRNRSSWRWISAIFVARQLHWNWPWPPVLAVHRLMTGPAGVSRAL